MPTLVNRWRGTNIKNYGESSDAWKYDSSVMAAVGVADSRHLYHATSWLFTLFTFMIHNQH